MFTDVAFPPTFEELSVNFEGLHGVKCAALSCSQKGSRSRKELAMRKMIIHSLTSVFEVSH